MVDEKLTNDTCRENISLWLKVLFNGEMTAKPYTLKCLNIGTPETINFPFVPNGKLMFFKCPYI